MKPDNKTTAEQLSKIGILNAKAYSLIIQNLDVDNLTLVTTMLPLADQFDGRKLWVLLKNKYAGNDHVADQPP
ncbi:hypothetical protein Pst134EA_017422 [Puccinia striiformis f. sp. tritici]|uniref:hypothetical protein n=1 Tax=Puccinia striiformis f. sp. tritici TaxID=168172 RepID=UPI0020088C1A|nr:hypothetical protein Pst134EA_017422 [Puccinia striiformis f. sp. tritici]KAH9461112.1 hypothetical protein Pst134EA_017422 [Puccinia striiformis f. sp. tritici]